MVSAGADFGEGGEGGGCCWLAQSGLEGFVVPAEEGAEFDLFAEFKGYRWMSLLTERLEFDLSCFQVLILWGEGFYFFERVHHLFGGAFEEFSAAEAEEDVTAK